MDLRARPIPSLILLAAWLWLMPGLHAQKNNQTDESGLRQGPWIIRDANDILLARGFYQNGQRQGEWQFFMSPIARRTETPDLVGNYEGGQKQGIWRFTEPRTKNVLKGRFEQDQMSGVWTHMNSDGDPLAKGGYLNGLRHGEWLIYRDKQQMAQGFYEQGQKTGIWNYDYYLSKGTVRVKGTLDYVDGLRKGRIESFKIEKHPKFERQELLVGVGTFDSGRKTGRWIEYQRNFKGEVIETGYYDGEGRRLGLWETVVDGRPFEECAYNDGLRHGQYRSFYEDGIVRYQASYEMGREHGLFAFFYEDGTMREKGAYTVIDEEEQTGDTIFYRVELPMEFIFRIVDEDYGSFNLATISWNVDPEFSAPAQELEARYKEFLSYGRSRSLRVQRIERLKRQSVRVGPYKAYHPNGAVKLEGNYYPAFFYGQGGGRKEFAKDGVWKEYDDLGYVQKTYVYYQGKLLKTIDNQGVETVHE